MVETGQYEMAQIYTTTISSRLDPKFMVFDVPFLFRDHDHASAVIDGPIGAELLSGLDRFGVKGLGFTYSGGYRILTSKGKSIKSLSDFVDTSVVAMGGVTNKVISETFEKLGAKPVSGSFAERQKLAEESTKGDVVETTYTRFWNSGEHRRLRTISETYHSMHLTTIVMNKKFFDGLSDNQKKIIAETSKELAVYERQQSIRLADEARDRAKSLGLKVHSVSSEVRNEMMERLRDVGRVGPYPFPRELVNRIDGTPSKAFLADR
jgi:TRAP-type C4-dicarboxylate transport system substrate-binding protein